MAQLVRAPARRAGDPGSNPGPGVNFSLKLLSSLVIYYKLIKVLTTKEVKYTLHSEFKKA